MRCTLMSKGAWAEPGAHHAIIEHDGTWREANIWHCWMGVGRTYQPPSSPPVQERLSFDLQMELSAFHGAFLGQSRPDYFSCQYLCAVLSLAMSAGPNWFQMFSGLKVKVGLCSDTNLPAHGTVGLHLPVFPFVQSAVNPSVCNYHFSHRQTDTSRTSNVKTKNGGTSRHMLALKSTRLSCLGCCRHVTSWCWLAGTLSLSQLGVLWCKVTQNWCVFKKGGGRALSLQPEQHQRQVNISKL